MIAASRPDAAVPPGPLGAERLRPWSLVRAGALLVALTLAVAARLVATTSGLADGVVVGLGFGVLLAAVAALDAVAVRESGSLHDTGAAGPGAVRPSISRALSDGPRLRAVAIGLAGGLGLVGLALVARLGAAVPLAAIPGGGAGFGPWAVATIVVAGGEEALLRGALLARLRDGAGIWTAILVTSVVFALMHVPFYGWRVVPLDLGVGLWLAGLRLESRGILAPWMAHAVADLATWWL